MNKVNDGGFRYAQPTLRIVMRLAIMTIIMLATESCRVQCRVVYNRPGPRCLSGDNSIAQISSTFNWRPALIENAGAALGIGPFANGGPLDALYLVRRIRRADTEAELGTIEDEIDDILKTQRAKAAAGDESAVDAATLNVAAHRLENLIHDRRQILANGLAAAPSG